MNNKMIKAVCTVFLVAVLFAGAASAADMTNEDDLVNITANVSSIVAAVGIHPQDIKIYNTSVLADTTNRDVYVNRGDDTAVDSLPLATVNLVTARTIADGKDAFVYEDFYVAGAADNKLTRTRLQSTRSPEKRCLLPH